MNKTNITLALALAGTLWIAGCDEAGDDHGDGTHTHADGTVHEDGDNHDGAENGDDHDHGKETPLPAVILGDMEVQLAQAHGELQPGKEGHLILKLPYDDKGATVIRAWIGTEDRTLSMVGKGKFAPSHGEYDIHTMAPDPLPEKVMWWIEIEKPDGTKVVGSATPLSY